MKQNTINQPFKINGIGVHSGQTVNLHLLPAPENTGIVFRRVDLNPWVEIPARKEYVVDTQLGTCIGKDNFRIATIEHLMAALFGCEIDNVYVDIDAKELPILDGSAAPFVDLIERVGITKQHDFRRYIRIKRAISVYEQEKFARLEPHDGFKLSCEIAYQHPCFNATNQRVELEFSKDNFISNIAPARTFGFYADYEFYQKNNLALGSSLENTIVFDHEKLINSEGLRYPNEMAKHKLLDVIGDLYVCGYRLLGEFIGYKTGHSLNHKLLQKLLQEKESWEFET